MTRRWPFLFSGGLVATARTSRANIPEEDFAKLGGPFGSDAPHGFFQRPRPNMDRQQNQKVLLIEKQSKLMPSRIGVRLNMGKKTMETAIQAGNPLGISAGGSSLGL